MEGFSEKYKYLWSLWPVLGGAEGLSWGLVSRLVPSKSWGSLGWQGAQPQLGHFVLLSLRVLAQTGTSWRE